MNLQRKIIGRITGENLLDLGTVVAAASLAYHNQGNNHETETIHTAIKYGPMAVQSAARAIPAAINTFTRNYERKLTAQTQDNRGKQNTTKATLDSVPPAIERGFERAAYGAFRAAVYGGIAYIVADQILKRL